MTSTSPRTIVTGRLVRLREKTLDDAPRDYEWRKDPELAEYDAARPITMPYRNFLATLTDDLSYPSSYRRTFAVEDIETGRHIGNVMYYGYDPMLQEAELGITIGDREYWSRGYGTDTVGSMLRYLFEDRGLRRVYLHTLSWNYRAQTAFGRAGFRRTRHVRRDGYEFEQMEIRREDWPPQASVATEAQPDD
ncbi:MAG: GNAT family N-acetyltransferase [Dehalococcoidia bacterium]